MIIIHYEMSRDKMDISLQDATLSWLVADGPVHHHGVPTQDKDENGPIFIL